MEDKIITLDEVYRKFGEVSEAAQLLETELGNVMLDVQGKEYALFDGDKPKLAKEIMEKINKSTLGQHLNRLEFPEKLGMLLENALVERNRLVHSFYRQHNFRRNSNAGRKMMFEDLEAIHDIILEAFKQVHLLQGIDLENIDLPLPIKHVSI